MLRSTVSADTAENEFSKDLRTTGEAIRVLVLGVRIFRISGRYLARSYADLRRWDVREPRTARFVQTMTASYDKWHQNMKLHVHHLVIVPHILAHAGF